MKIRSALLSLFLLLLASGEIRAGDAEEDWQAVIALDAGPQEQPKSPEAAAQMVLAHLARQEKALRGFIAGHAQDARGFEARLRLARLLQIRADFEGSEKPRAEARRLLAELEKTATPEQRPELDFAKVARLMRGLRPSDSAQRDEVLKAARDFQAAHPADRRLAALFAEVATLFDAQPRTKEVLLEDAQALATDGELKSRIADDLKRVRLLGREVPLRFTSVQGQEIQPADLQGRPVFVLFFANFSPPSLTALDRLQQEIAELPKGSVRVLGVCLDERREVVTALIKGRNILWPVAFDGKSWQGPLVRKLGINALPTVWLLDARGRLRSINALDGAAAKARQLLQER
jgi:peroxiredoxin